MKEQLNERKTDLKKERRGMKERIGLRNPDEGTYIPRRPWYGAKI